MGRASSSVILCESGGIQRYLKPRMELRIREVDQGGEGPFDRLRDRGSFGTVGELAELAVKFKEG